MIGQYEVTNEEYKGFVNAGGYETTEFWEQAFVEDGDTLSWEEAMARFVDRTGRPGPSTWEVSDFPDGAGDFPVTGISWYEAEAFARYAGKALPTAYHWYHAAGIGWGWVVVPASNLNGEALSRVGEFRGLGPYGTLDMAGNAREWVFNSSGSRRFILGGAWNDPTWALVGAQAAPPFDRSETNGVRLASFLGDTADLSITTRPIDRTSRNFAQETPVPDEIFSIYQRMYAYDDAPLNVVLESVDTTADWFHEQVTFDAAYRPERVILHLFLPRQHNPPFQTVVYFPGSGAVTQRAFEGHGALRFHVPFVVKSGRAFAFPLYKSTFERGDGYEYRRQDGSNTHRDHVIQWGKDLKRSIDYLTTRSDIDSDGLAYFGYSWGGMMGGLMLAIEPRLRTGILYVAGFSTLPVQPEADPFNFVSRVSVPVLMLNGRYDYVFPLETSATPMFEMLGTPVEHKHHIISEGGHFVPHTQLVRESLAWLDRYLGPVR